MDWILMAVLALAFVIASIPLYVSAMIFGGRVSLAKAVFTNIIAGVLFAFVFAFFDSYAALIYFVLLLFVYKAMFELGWIRAFLVWLISAIIMLVIILALVIAGFMVI